MEEKRKRGGEEGESLCSDDSCNQGYYHTQSSFFEDLYVD